MATASAREELKKALRLRYGDEKAKMVAYRTDPDKAKVLAERMEQAGKVERLSGPAPKKASAKKATPRS